MAIPVDRVWRTAVLRLRKSRTRLKATWSSTQLAPGAELVPGVQLE